MTAPVASRAGIFHRARVRLFGERDAVADQLHDLARQGSGMARLAHLCAFLLVILFSAGSLVALSADALSSTLSGLHAGRVDVPSAISVAVSTLLVVAMDVGMIYAAAMVRLLLTRRAGSREMVLHVAVLIVVGLLEASTYAYMSWVYDRPASLVAWAIILARAAAAPALAVYLSLARALPVTARDILAQTELAAGKGLVRDVVSIAADADATLERKAGVFQAVAVMGLDDAQRLAKLLDVAGASDDDLSMRSERSHTHRALPSPYTPENPWPTNGGSPLGMAIPDFPQDETPTNPGIWAREYAGTASQPRMTPDLAASGQSGPWTTPAEWARQASANVYLDADPLMSRKKLQQTLRCRAETAASLYNVWYYRHDGHAKRKAAKEANGANGANGDEPTLAPEDFSDVGQVAQ